MEKTEGIFCIGGVCRAVPASNGLEIAFTSRFDRFGLVGRILAFLSHMKHLIEFKTKPVMKQFYSPWLRP